MLKERLLKFLYAPFLVPATNQEITKVIVLICGSAYESQKQPSNKVVLCSGIQGPQYAQQALSSVIKIQRG